MFDVQDHPVQYLICKGYPVLGKIEVALTNDAQPEFTDTLDKAIELAEAIRLNRFESVETEILIFKLEAVNRAGEVYAR